MGLSLAQAVAGFHGVEAVAEFLVAGEGSVVGDNKIIVVVWGPSMDPPSPIYLFFVAAGFSLRERICFL
jgi:hypothetical protein